MENIVSVTLIAESYYYHTWCTNRSSPPCDGVTKPNPAMCSKALDCIECRTLAVPGRRQQLISPSTANNAAGQPK